MAGESRMSLQAEKPKILVPRMICLDTEKNSSPTMARGVSSVPSSPSLMKTNSVKYNCLCSPTTHAGSFRCRLHRNTGSLGRSSISVGAKLSELGGKPAGMCRPNEMCDVLHAQ